MKRTLIAVALCCTLPCVGLGQTAASQTEIRTETIVKSIELLSRVRHGLSRFSADYRPTVLKVVSLRLTNCGLLYGVLSSNPSSSAESKLSLKEASDIYAGAGAFLFPGPASTYKAALDSASAILEPIRQNRERLRLLLENCKAFSVSPEAAHKAMLNAVADQD